MDVHQQDTWTKCFDSCLYSIHGSYGFDEAKYSVSLRSPMDCGLQWDSSAFNDASLRCVTGSIKGCAFNYSNLRKSAHIQFQSPLEFGGLGWGSQNVEAPNLKFPTKWFLKSISHICVSARSQTQDPNLEKTSCKTICKTEFRTPNPPQILKTNRSSQTPTLQHVTPIRKAEQPNPWISHEKPRISHFFITPAVPWLQSPTAPNSTRRNWSPPLPCVPGSPSEALGKSLGKTHGKRWF